VSAPERRTGRSAGLRLTPVVADVVELAALPGRAAALRARAAERAVALPDRLGSGATPDGLAIAARPDRWLLLTGRAPPAASAVRWREFAANDGVAIDLSAGFALLHLAGEQLRAVLARGCRLDLDADVFGPRQAATTIIAQVSVTLAALPSGLLLLTPVTTARYFSEWLAASAAPFGFESLPGQPLAELSGETR